MTSERAEIRVRLDGADYPPGEIPLAELGRIATTAQQLATRLGRAEEGRGGPGRTPSHVTEGVRLLLVGIEVSSTLLVLAGPPREPQLDLGPAADELIERTLGNLIDGLAAAANGKPLPPVYDDPSRRGLTDLLAALGAAAPEVDVEGRIGARRIEPINLRPAEVAGSILGQAPPAAAPPVTVGGVLYAADLRNGRYRIEDDIGTSIYLVNNLFTSDRVGPLLGKRVVVGGTATYDERGRIKEIEATTIDPADGADVDVVDFEATVDLDELLADTEPLRSVDDLAIPGLSEDELDAFVRSLRS